MPIISRSTTKFASKSVTGPPLRSAHVNNSKGFNPTVRSLGHDTVPGPEKGAPLMQSRKVDDSTVVRKHYPQGGPDAVRPTRDKMAGIGKAADSSRPMPPIHNSRAHSDLMSKAANESASQLAIGNAPRGTIKR